MSYITLSEARKQCEIDADWHNDDNYLLHLIEVSENAVSKQINRPLYACVTQEGILPPTIKHAVLLTVATLYENREAVSPAQLHKVPMTFDWLCGLDRHYHIPR